MSAAALLIVAALQAPSRPPVRLVIEGCAGVDVEEVRRIVGVELRALVATGETTGPVTRAEARCSDGAAEVQVRDPVSGKTLTRGVDLLASSDRARARLLALAIVEMVSASWTELEADAPPRPVPPAPLAVAAGPPPPRAPPRFQTTALVGGRHFLASSAGIPLLPGAGIRVAAALRPALAAAAYLVAERARPQVVGGHATVESASLGLSLLWHRGHGALAARAGGGLLAGTARLRGVAADPDQHDEHALVGLWAGPAAAASGILHLGRSFLLEVLAEGGAVLLPVGGTVDGAREIAIEGPWIGAYLSLGVAY